MRHKVLFSVLLGAFLCAAPALAEQIIHFTNGTSMPIRSHEIEGKMIHVDLGGDAFIAFPVSMVDKVVDAGKEVVLEPSNPGANKIMKVSGGPEGSFPLRGQAPSGGKPIPDGVDRKYVSPVETDPKTGLATVRPFAGGGHAAKQNLRVSGNQGLLRQGGTGDDGYRGTTRIGSRHVIGPVGPPGRKGRVPVMTMQPQPGPGPVAPPAEQPTEGSDSGDSGSEN